MHIPRMRWVIAAMLFLATAVNYVADRLALSLVIVAPDLKAEVAMNDVRRLFPDRRRLPPRLRDHVRRLRLSIVDRLGTKRGFAFFIGLWSLAAMLHAFAWNTISFG